MKKYRIKNTIIHADSIVEAVKFYKDSMKERDDSFTNRINNAVKKGKLTDPVYRGKYGLIATRSEFDQIKKELEQLGYKEVYFQTNPYYRYTVFFTDSMKDEDIDQLSEEEKKAIEDYKAAIAGTTNINLLRLYAHILKEEIEHLEELQNAKSGEFEDSPDLETTSGRQESNLQKAMAALEVIPTNKWNRSGYKINIDNNRITLVCREDGVIWKNYKGGNTDMKFTNTVALKSALKEERL